MRSRRPSLSTVIASLALFFALGGSAIAAQHYIITSSSQIKPSVLAKLKGNTGATGATGAQGPAGPAGAQGPTGLAGSTGPQGPAGPVGSRGPMGPIGAPGERGAEGPMGQRGPEGPIGGSSDLSALTIVNGESESIPKETVGGSIATCPAGSDVVSGGGYTGLANVADSEMSSNHQSWILIVVNETLISTHLEAVAYCAVAGQAIAASMPSAIHAQAVQQAHQQVDRLVSELTEEAKAARR